MINNVTVNDSVHWLCYAVLIQNYPLLISFYSKIVDNFDCIKNELNLNKSVFYSSHSDPSGTATEDCPEKYSRTWRQL